MTQSQENDRQESNQQDNLQSPLLESFLNPILNNLGNAIGKIIASLLPIAIIIWVIKSKINVLSIFGIDTQHLQTFLPLGLSTGLLLYLTAALSTPVTVAFGIAVIIFLLISNAM